MNGRMILTLAGLLACWGAHAQVNSGSNGSDGAFHPTEHTVIDMADHPDGIYHYTSVNIPSDVTVTFIPNANNTPVVWLVQNSVVINGTVDLSGGASSGIVPGQGGPGGGAGGYGGQGESWLARRGDGLGGGDAAQQDLSSCGGGGSYATVGGSIDDFTAPGQLYGNKFLLPLLGGSGGGGGHSYGGGGGGGALLIVSDTSIVIDGDVVANGGSARIYHLGGTSGSGGGSGGGIRLVAPVIAGNGSIKASGGPGRVITPPIRLADGGSGFVRLDALDDRFVGTLYDSASRGFNPIVVQPTTSISLRVQSIGGVPVSASPSGQLSTPDALLSAQQNNPIPVVVQCANLPLHTTITVTVKPANGAAVSATGLNNVGTPASSTATVLLNMPRGGGLIYATAATGN
ncbi:MAG: hypothetical protein KIS67_05210 [Verrucomicrobiae bacterium]|nr:hypothetical protein [Verrucomicrobiae bacterium]